MSAYQPKTGNRCHCRKGMERDNCPACEGTGQRIDFAAIRARSRQRAWVVYLNGRSIDTVFYTPDCDADYVCRSLIEHDNYDPRITVRGQVQS